MNSTRSFIPLLVAGCILTLGLSAPAGTIYPWGSETTAPEGDNFTAIAAGTGFSLAVDSDGVIHGWGSNTNGQLNLPAGEDYEDVAAGQFHSLALKADGSIVGAGRNIEGQLNFPAGTDYVAISAGGWHSVAMRSSGAIVAVGSNFYGEGTSPIGANYKAVDAGLSFNVAIKSDGSLQVWGRVTGNQAALTDELPTGNNFVAVSAGGYREGVAVVQHAMALRADGSIAVWGNNDALEANAPQDAGYTAISAGGNFCVAIKRDGSLYAWNADGVMSVPGGNAFVKVSAGTDHALALEQFGYLELLSPVGGESFATGSVQPIRWQAVGGGVGAVIVDYTLDGTNWYEVSPPARPETTVTDPNGITQYDWFVPLSNSDACRVRVTPAVGEAVQSGAFRIFHCPLRADADGDCDVDMDDYLIMLEEWLHSDDLVAGRGYAGDFDGDGDVDDADLAVFDAAWLSRRGDANWNPAVDISMPADGVIDILDWVIFSQNYLMGVE